MNAAILPLLATAVLAVNTSPCCAKEDSDAQGFLMKTVKVGEKTFKYVVYVPEAYNPQKPMPTIVFLNGWGECGTDGLRQVPVGLGGAVMTNVQKWPFIIIFPQKQVQEANWESEDAMVMATLDATRKSYNVDASRIYLTGLSQGGHGTWTIAANHPDIFAAIAPICGWADEETAKKVSKLPIWVFHGEADDAVPFKSSQEMVGYLKAAGADVKLTSYPGVGHNSWDKAYREENLGDWFLQHHK